MGDPVDIDLSKWKLGRVVKYNNFRTREQIEAAAQARVEEMMRPLREGEVDHVFARYASVRLPARQVISEKPYMIRFGQVQVSAYQSEPDLLRISINENSPLRRNRPKWWISGFSRFQPWALGLFDTLIDLDRVELEPTDPPNLLYVDHKPVCQFFGLHGDKVKALLRSGIQRCRLIGFFDPFENDEDRLAYLGEWM